MSFAVSIGHQSFNYKSANVRWGVFTTTTAGGPDFYSMYRIIWAKRVVSSPTTTNTKMKTLMLQTGKFTILII